MSSFLRVPSPPRAGVELSVLTLLAYAAFVSIPATLGGIGLSWDALNHHIYLGWTAEHPRFDRDYLAASYQSYQYPYLYWPVYKLATSGATGMTAGVILALMQGLAVPPVCLIAQICIPGRDWFHVIMRGIAVALAFMSAVVLSLFASTSNDLSAAVPLVWALAFAMSPFSLENPKNPKQAVSLSALFAGLAIAVKLSNGPLVAVLPLMWLWYPGNLASRAMRLFQGCSLMTAMFLLVYGYWGWKLWAHFGNPIYPLYDNWFEPIRNLVGWSS